MDRVWRQNQQAVAEAAARIECLEDAHAISLEDKTVTIHNLNKQLDAEKKLRTQEMTKMQLVHEEAPTKTQKDAKSAQSTARLALLQDLKTRIYNVLERVVRCEAAPEDFKSPVQRQYEAGTKHTVGRDNGEAEKVHREYEEHIKALKRDEEHCSQLFKVIETTEAASNFAKETREVAKHKEKVPAADEKKMGNTTTTSSKDSQVPAAESITMSKRDFDDVLEDAVSVTAQTLMRTIAASQLMLEHKLLEEE
ncbi:hypothetical protein PTMSG1_00686 [Pyrenophora teres f. maculata]|nr:hypothetical protein PTMSG1_00686 [Pyrenophora teres f. maculata]